MIYIYIYIHSFLLFRAGFIRYSAISALEVINEIDVFLWIISLKQMQKQNIFSIYIYIYICNMYHIQGDLKVRYPF